MPGRPSWSSGSPRPSAAGLLGYYRSTYVDTTGTERVLAATQFEAPHARRAFPCFDEPEFKATFDVTLVVAEGLLAISNGPEIGRESLGDGRVRVHFGPTIPMSTYLVAWVVGPLDITEPVDAGGVAVRVAHVPGKAHLTKFALDVGSFAIKFFADYYGIAYPGEKCDLVALPDFSFGAMENLGCVTFREARLLLDPEQVTLSEMSDAALTIVHEVAHMWFGDLVTMKWWNGIWLNEAFATFMEHLGVDAYAGSWKTWDDFALGRAAALDVDALSNTRTVEYEVITPEDADGMFDLLTYQKGGSVLRMLERWLGADAFRAGVRAYLDRYKLGNTETTDLWDSLESATSLPVRSIMDSWIFQPGFPLVSAGRDGGRVTIAQERFAYEQEPDAQRWSIPVRARISAAGSTETRSLLLTDAAMSIDVPADALVVLDAGGEGFYRVAYPLEWRAELLDAGVLESLERFSLIDDSWAAVLSGRTPASELLALARQLRNEDDLVVWRVLVSVLRGLSRLVEGPALARLKADVAGILEPTFGRLGWQPEAGDDARTRQLRGIVLDALGTLVEDPSVIARARETFTERGHRSRRRRRVRVDRGERRRCRYAGRLHAPRRTRRPLRRNSCATSTRSARSHRRSSCSARPSSPCRIRCGRRTGRSCSSARCATVNTVRRHGHSCATGGTRCRPASRARSFRGCSTASPGSSTTRHSPTSRSSSPSTRCPKARG